MVDGKPDRDGYPFQVHADERTTDVQTSFRLNGFDKDRMGKIFICCGRKGAARFGLWNSVDDLKAMSRGIGRLHDKRAIQMLAALSRKKNLFFFYSVIDP